jgi:hypothetical protein
MGYLLLVTDDFYNYELVINWCGKPKVFRTEDEAYFYAKELELQPFQIIEITI